jgi:hypothetical protein
VLSKVTTTLPVVGLAVIPVPPVTSSTGTLGISLVKAKVPEEAGTL